MDHRGINPVASDGSEDCGTIDWGPEIITRDFSEHYDALVSKFWSKFALDFKTTIDAIMLELGFNFVGLSPGPYMRYRHEHHLALRLDIAYSVSLRSVLIVFESSDLDLVVREEAFSPKDFVQKIGNVCSVILSRLRE